MSITTRALEPGDRLQWEPLFRGYLTFYKSSLPDDVIDETWARLLSDDPQFHAGICAVDGNGDLVGIAHIIFHRSTWSKTYYCYLEDLFVSPDVRAKGIGRQLIDAVYIAADARECTRTYWATQEFNYRARGLYDQVATKSPFLQYRR
ncbi:MAG: GNAT family N-acetyltransferase [Hyphomicrobiaceae bacterium]